MCTCTLLEICINVPSYAHALIHIAESLVVASSGQLGFAVPGPGSSR